MIKTEGVAELLKNNFVYTAMVTSIFKERGPVLDVLLAKTGASIDTKGRTGNNLLMFASMWGKYDIVEYLIKNGAAINERNVDGETALSLARKNGHYDVATLLVQNGAVNKINSV